MCRVTGHRWEPLRRSDGALLLICQRCALALDWTQARDEWEVMRRGAAPWRDRAEAV